MQPSYIYCKVCGYTLNEHDFPRSVIRKYQGFQGFPTDDEDVFDALLSFARENIRCPGCGNRAWIRKRWDKV